MTQLSRDPVRIHNPNVPVYSDFRASGIEPGKFINAFAGDEPAIDPGHATVKAMDMYLPHFSVRATEGEFHRDAILVNQTGEGKDLLGSCLFLKGTFKSRLPGQNNTVDGYARSQNFKFDPDNEYEHIIPAGEAFHLIHFSYTADNFFRFLPENESWADELKTRIEKRERILGDEVTPITFHQEHALKQVMDCPLSGKLGLVLMETSVIQIILMQLQALFGTQGEGCKYQMNKRDLEVIHGLRALLKERFLEDHSLHNLSRHAGMSTNKLMLLFKKVFRQSIFDYIGDLRMEHARQLLYERQMLVTQIASVIGYKNPNHFSAAFKKRFGINPSNIRQARI